MQLPEACAEKSEAFHAGYKTIADICKERLRRAGKKIQAEHPDKKLDVGFRVFKLDSSNIETWDPTFETLEDDLIAAVDNIKPDRCADDLLFEILLKYGLDLSLPIETNDLGGKKVYVLGGGALMVCFDKDLSMQTIEGIGQLKERLQPEVLRVVFRDHCFENDKMKTNALHTLKQDYAITDIKSL
ncbi:MAG: hypothetical protein J6P38_03145 [Acetobacter sp.]|nr:hypothetical protein [Acetobacter sp.]